MARYFDLQTLARFRSLPSRRVYEAAKNAVYGLGAVSSADFLDVYQELVEEGILSWEQIDAFEQGSDPES